MKTYLTLSFFLILVLIIQNNHGQSTRIEPPEGLLGEMNWQMVSGRIQKYPNKEGYYRFEMSNYRIDDICHPFNLPGTVLEFTIELEKAFNNEIECTAKLYYENTDGGDTGAVKVKLSLIDNKAGIIKGWVFAYFDMGGKITGNFTIDWCPGL